MEFISGNVLIRPMCFAKGGDEVQGHAHNFDHTTYVVRGALRIEQVEVISEAEWDVDLVSNQRVLVKPAEVKVIRCVDKKASDGHNWVLIKAGVRHRITALEDHSIGHCIYAHRTPQGDVVQEWDGWEKAYV